MKTLLASVLRHFLTFAKVQKSHNFRKVQGTSVIYLMALTSLVNLTHAAGCKFHDHRRLAVSNYLLTAPNTFFITSVVRATGFSRIRFSSSATILNSPSKALPVT